MKYLVLIFIVLNFSSVAFAQQGKVVECGIPEDVNIDTDPAYEFCDIYTRQLHYREKRQELRKAIDERRESFAGPGIAARNAYFDAIKADHERQDRERDAAKAAKEAAEKESKK